jgi:CRP-like cAMP-binding protein
MKGPRVHAGFLKQETGQDMAVSVDRDGTSNRILMDLSDEDYVLLNGHLSRVDLPLRRKLELSNRHIEHVYFMESGFASVVANGSGDDAIEVALIGREGVTGVPVIMGADRWPNETFIQSAAIAKRIPAETLADVIKQSETLHQTLLTYCHTFLVQISQTALSNGRGKIEQRLARWLCMAHDRSDGNELGLTHEFLALTLGVRRPGVTLALEQLARDGLIRLKRGRITIANRRLLELRTNGAYGRAEIEFDRLFSNGAERSR